MDDDKAMQAWANALADERSALMYDGDTLHLWCMGDIEYLYPLSPRE